MRPVSPSVRLATLLIAGAFAGASAAGATAISATPAHQTIAPMLAGDTFLKYAAAKPLLVANSGQTNGLEDWPINPKGSSHPRNLSAPLGLGNAALVANGEIVYAAMQNPPQILAYNVKTKAQSTLADPFGTPIDIAIGKDGSLYLMNFLSTGGNVAWYPKGSGAAQELNCKYVRLGESVAVDNEGDIFVQGYGFGRFTGVVEIPNGPSGPQPNACKPLHLVSENGTYTAGVVVDPKTDDLVTLDNPDLCAGGNEGRMTVYPKPYRAKTAHSVVLGGNCTGGIRLNADSTLVFYLDESVSGGFTYIDSSTFPQGQPLGIYSEGGSFGGPGPGGFTTIPNTLPN